MMQAHLSARDLHYQAHRPNNSFATDISKESFLSIWRASIHWVPAFVAIAMSATILVAFTISSHAEMASDSSPIEVQSHIHRARVAGAAVTSGLVGYWGFDAQPSTFEDNSGPHTDDLAPGEGSLVKTADNPTVWLISEGSRHGFTDSSVFLGLGFNFSLVLEVTNNELYALPEGPLLNNSTDSHKPGVYINMDGTIYRVNSDGTKSGTPSLDVWNSLNPDNDFTRVVPANNSDRNLTNGALLTLRGVQ